LTASAASRIYSGVDGARCAGVGDVMADEKVYPNTRRERCEQCKKIPQYIIRPHGHVFCSALCWGNWGNDLDWWAKP
jgi:hypothetical protein